VKRLFYILPVLGFGVLAFFMFRSLTAPAPDVLPSALIDRPVPSIALPPLDAGTKGFTRSDLTAGHVSLVNVFASWCIPCRQEGPALTALAAMKGVALYGMVQKDTPAKVHAFLAQLGDPYQRIDLDADGRGSIEWGVYGVPETFVVDGKGIVRLRYVGALTPEALRDQVLPAIASAR
jgi:cytochrome c biogenesis protein CcmG/thiol:disulfide interchange protein DsbE